MYTLMEKMLVILETKEEKTPYGVVVTYCRHVMSEQWEASNTLLFQYLGTLS